MRTGANRRQASHPDFSQMALYAGGDLSWWSRLRMRVHLRSCQPCDVSLQQLRTVRSELVHQASSETLTGFEAIVDWSRLESEMLGNISVGIAAARCVETNGDLRKWVLGTLSMAAVTVLFVAGWLTHIPAEKTQQVFHKISQWANVEPAMPVGTVMSSSPEGIAVRSQGLTLTMRHPRSATVSVIGSSGMEARFVDEETGQVTISGVYGQ